MAGILAGITVLCTVASIWFMVSRAPDPDNTALVDANTTKTVTDQVGRAIRTIFSYDPTQLDQTAAEAGKVLTGQAMTQYNALFNAAKDHALTTHQVLTTAVRSIGVTTLRNDTAKLLVFVDRQVVTGDQHQSAVAQLLVTATQSGDSWKIADIQVF